MIIAIHKNDLGQHSGELFSVYFGLTLDDVVELTEEYSGFSAEDFVYAEVGNFMAVEKQKFNVVPYITTKEK